VPDVRLLPARAAERRLAAHDLRARDAGQGTRVLTQEPAAGTAVERGAVVTLWLSAPEDARDRRLPDVTGLSVRAAMRRLAPHQVAAKIVGKGTVVRQLPAAGTRLPIAGPCVLYCEPGGTATVSTQGGPTAAAVTHTSRRWLAQEGTS
jgi:beta-lactam-binding protein with PASTA domain